MHAAILGLAVVAQASYGGEASATPPLDAGVTIRLSADGHRIEIRGVEESTLAVLRRAQFDAKQWPNVCAMHVARQEAAQTLPLLGKYEVDGNVITFTPRFPLRPGIRYRATFDSAAIPGLRDSHVPKTEAILALPGVRPTTPTRVVAVFPSGDVLPENLLKFYIHFSAPMSRGDAYQHIRIVDSDDREISDAFLELGEELWSPNLQRLTLLFDPGRIKRGVKPNEDLGSSLHEGRRYALVIDAGWRDAQAAPLGAEFRKEFEVASPDETQPNPRSWRITPPAAHTREPLVVAFDEPLDHSLLERMIAVRHRDHVIDGQIAVDQEESRWSFTRDAIWKAGAYELLIDGTLEDRAGNSVGRPFEVRNPKTKPDASAIPQVSIPFVVREP